MPFRDGYLIPPNYHLETRMRRGPVIAGAIMAGAGYAVAAATAASLTQESNEAEILPLYIPFVGPFISVASIDWDGDFAGLAFAIIGVPLILDGLVQTTGGIMLAWGLANPKQVLVRDGAYMGDTRPRLRISPTGVRIEGSF